MSKRLFGTDGVRGEANVGLTALLAMQLGAAAGTLLARQSGHFAPAVIIGRDTRLSGQMLEAALSAGFSSVGVHVLSLGVAPTPSVSRAVILEGAIGGAVISASHNPFRDNGIKFFGSDGRKLPDATEDEIACLVDGFHELTRATGSDVGTVLYNDELLLGVKDALRATMVSHEKKPLAGLKLVVDCANGAAYHIAPELLRDLGAEVDVIHDKPDGMNINLQCGSTHPHEMAARTREIGADAGLAFDGDADRVIMANHRGDVVDGDHMMAVLAIDLKNRGELNGNRVIATIMSNAGLERLLATHDIDLLRTDVGDRYVAQAMDEYGASLGGEQSGHILLPAVTPTGDGLATALQILGVMTRTNKQLAELTEDLKVFPQLLRNVKVASSAGWNQDPHIVAAINEQRDRFPNPQWLSVRPSGTEPLLRVMAQAEEAELVEGAVAHICDVIQQRLGSGVQ